MHAERKCNSVETFSYFDEFLIGPFPLLSSRFSVLLLLLSVLPLLQCEPTLLPSLGAVRVGRRVRDETAFIHARVEHDLGSGPREHPDTHASKATQATDQRRRSMTTLPKVCHIANSINDPQKS